MLFMEGKYCYMCVGSNFQKCVIFNAIFWKKRKNCHLNLKRTIAIHTYVCNVCAQPFCGHSLYSSIIYVLRRESIDLQGLRFSWK